MGGGAYIVCKGSFKGTKMGGGSKGSAKPHKDIVKGDRGGGGGEKKKKKKKGGNILFL